MLETEHPYFAFIKKNKTKKKKHFSQWIWIILNENPYFLKNKKKTYFVLGLFSKTKKGRKEKQNNAENESTLWCMGHLYWKHIGHEPYDIKHGRFSVGGGGDRFGVLERCATQDNPNGCITNSTQNIRYRKEQQF